MLKILKILLCQSRRPHPPPPCVGRAAHALIDPWHPGRTFAYGAARRRSSPGGIGLTDGGWRVTDGSSWSTDSGWPAAVTRRLALCGALERTGGRQVVFCLFRPQGKGQGNRTTAQLRRSSSGPRVQSTGIGPSSPGITRCPPPLPWTSQVSSGAACLRASHARARRHVAPVGGSPGLPVMPWKCVCGGAARWRPQWPRTRAGPWGCEAHRQHEEGVPQGTGQGRGLTSSCPVVLKAVCPHPPPRAALEGKGPQRWLENGRWRRLPKRLVAVTVGCKCH